MPHRFNNIHQLSQTNGHHPQARIVSSDAPEFSDLAIAMDGSSFLTMGAATDLIPSAEDWSPLTQELVDTLPRVWTRGFLYLLVSCTGVVLPWAMLTKVDQTGTARGRLEPQGQTYRLDAPVSGEVVAIDAQEGQVVRAGQTLVELDSKLVETDLQQAQAKLEGQLNRLTQLEQIKSQVAIATRTQQLQNQAQLAEQQAQIAQVVQKFQASQRDYSLLQERLRKDLSEVERYRELWQEGVVPQIKVVELDRVADESKRLVEQAQAEIQQAQSEWVKQQSTYERVMHAGELALIDSQKQAEDLQAQMGDLQAEIAQTKKLITSLQLQLKQHTIHAPITGTIFQLPITKPGEVVQPGEMLAQIAPEGTPLVFRAQMPSSESGFLEKGMPVKIKFDAYPFQDYGVVPGHLSWISPDSKVVQTPQGEIEVFEVEVKLDQNYIQAPDKRIALTPGQTATAEVIVRQRHIIDFVLDPFKKLQSGEFQL